jgi:hypothetical protein
MRSKHDPCKHVPALRAWARVELGMPREEFDSLEPSEFIRLYNVWEGRERRYRVQDARLRYTIAASAGARAADGSPLKPDYFLKSPPKKRKPKTAAQLEREFIKALPKEWRP